ncbi:DUF3037 domain-containing protein, partial [Streptomyces pharetrae]|uniref:DUF3037 domain-containing protein n=1 Tax=Streptomyces pharetrae TaxID=291370 RepID=UPI0036583711
RSTGAHGRGGDGGRVRVGHCTGGVQEGHHRRAGGDAAGQAAGDDAGRRFRWLIAPRSTIVQPGPVHTGLTADPAAETERLLDLLVR